MAHFAQLVAVYLPEHPAADNRGQVRLVGETMRVLLISQEIQAERAHTE